MRSSMPCGRRNEMAVVDSLRLGNRALCALLQSTEPAESWVCQNSRSSASLRKRGIGPVIGLSFLRIGGSFPAVRVARGDHANSRLIVTERERDMEQAAFDRLS